MEKSIRFLSIILLIFIGLSAIGGGGMLIYDHSGNSMQFSIELLAQTPFENYLLPGIVLFLFIGVLSLVIAVIAIRKLSSYPWLIILQGMILIIWLIVELFFNLDFYHPEYHIPLLLIGVYLIIAGLRLRKSF
ncbi:MAG: hypothetical protein DRI95_12765 [Bacteroidetes bacterium]|nr:MAG: hypothetical protein DRI95_12765 [Bacteroidota bacterium]